MEPVANLGIATTIDFDLLPKIEVDTKQGMVATKEQVENYLPKATTTTTTLSSTVEVATS